MKFGNYKNQETLEEARKTQDISKFQPAPGKAAVTSDGINIDNSVVLSKGLVAIGQLGSGGSISLIDYKFDKLLALLDSNDWKHLRKVK